MIVYKTATTERTTISSTSTTTSFGYQKRKKVNLRSFRPTADLSCYRNYTPTKPEYTSTSKKVLGFLPSKPKARLVLD